MKDGNEANPLLRNRTWELGNFTPKDVVVFFISGVLFGVVAITGGVLLYDVMSTKPDENLWILVALLAVSYVYALFVAQASVKSLERAGEVENITQILRLYAVACYLMVCAVYVVVIIKLGEQDYKLPRYLQYAATLTVSFGAARVYAAIPKTQDVWLLGVLVLLFNMGHLGRMVWVYVIVGVTAANYFAQDVIILIAMAVAAIYTPFGSWKVVE